MMHLWTGRVQQDRGEHVQVVVERDSSDAGSGGYLLYSCRPRGYCGRDKCGEPGYFDSHAWFSIVNARIPSAFV